MKEILESRIGKEIELSFGGGAVGGKIVKIENDILQLEKDDQTFFVRLEKIVAIWDAKEKNEKKVKSPGFVSSQSD
ncbi:MAG: MM0924 family protein [Blastocatellia bacterium]